MSAIPEGLKYSKQHVWVKILEDTVLLGITDYAQDQLGDILFVDLPVVDDEINIGEVFTEVESSKSNVEVESPLSGIVVAVNEELDDEPEGINESPYAAWIAEIELKDPQELRKLLSADEYAETLED
jgi:glycine cleavage system H protein